MATSSSSKVCYYELLGVSRKADDAELKTSYRKLALRFHPDKAPQNNLTNEEATQRFQALNEAYATLSDPQERAWYDAHREQILYGDDDDNENGVDPFEKQLNLWSYFRSSCFQGFSDTDPKGFFIVYEELFRKIDIAEQDYYSDDSEEEEGNNSSSSSSNPNNKGNNNNKNKSAASSSKKNTFAPAFGKSGDDWASSTSKFYSHWQNFATKRPFGHADKYNPNEAPNRKVRRLIEQENKKLRQAARQEYNEKVRKLVGICMRRDPRFEQFEKEKAKKQREKTEKFEKQQQLDLERKKAARLAAKQEEIERWEEAERLLREQEEKYGGGLLSGNEVATDPDDVQCRNASRTPREEQDEQDADNSPAPQVFVCELCRKNFKTENQFSAHCKSKKHLQAVAAMMEAVESSEGELVEDDEDDAPMDDEDSDTSEEAAVERQQVGEQRHDDDEDPDDKSSAPASPSSSQPSPEKNRRKSRRQSTSSKGSSRSGTRRRKDSKTTEQDSSDESSDDDAFLSRFANLKTKQNSCKAKNVDAASDVDDEVDEEAEDSQEPSCKKNLNFSPSNRSRAAGQDAGESSPPAVAAKAENDTSGLDKSSEAAGNKNDAVPASVIDKISSPADAKDSDDAGDVEDVPNGNEGDNVETSLPPTDDTTKKEKRKRRRAKPPDDGAANNPTHRSVPAQSGDSWPEAAASAVILCAYCRQTFSTKNKLFDHLKKNPTHMALKTNASANSKKNHDAMLANFGVGNGGGKKENNKRGNR
ncbi:unnamed protein product [Amoebophrya sp. A120]|nr:unnamed protein product [Amoebophrya sp. A120]|eukprot:GSA120T00017244001.1